jgi:hybrid cluster-associated redox disulfide protein
LALITHDMTISSVVERWPDAARIFARYGLSCASCSISKSETIMAGATGHGGGRVNVEDLMRDLNSYADSGKLPDNLPAANATAGAPGMKMRGMAEQKGIKHVIAVMSGKGGVGKSLVAGLLAVELKRRGFSVGVLDGDITGPSIPRMFGVREKPGVAGPNTLKPSVSRGGIPIMSMNLLLPGEEEAVIWRGPMVSGAIRQFFSDVAWGELDYLIVDLPPGTSDAPLTVMQALPIAGVVLVTTPQALATMVVTKAVRLVKQLGGDILGVVENMSYVAMPDGSRNEVFGPSQGLKLVIAANAPLMAKIPVDPLIAHDADTGEIESYVSPESDELVDNFLLVAQISIRRSVQIIRAALRHGVDQHAGEVSVPRVVGRQEYLILLHCLE